MNRALRVDITNVDVVTLEHIAAAESQASPTPPAFVDTLVRLSKRGLIRGDATRRVMLTDAGRAFLRDRSPATSARFALSTERVDKAVIKSG